MPLKLVDYGKRIFNTHTMDETCGKLIVEPQLSLPLSPLFPLLYFTLCNGPKYSPKTTKIIFSEYDYIIVGAGSAGSALAARLSEVPCVNILLLEAGKEPPLLSEVPAVRFINTSIDWYFTTVPQKYAARLSLDRRLRYSAGKVIGGTSVINGLEYLRGSRQIYDEWQKLGADGWAYDDVLPYFKKMENNANPESIDIAFHGFDGPMSVENSRYNLKHKALMKSAVYEIGYRLIDPNGKTQIGLYNTQFNKRKGRRCSTAKAYLVPAANRKNLHIVSEAFVTKILIKGKQAVGVEFKSGDKYYEIRALKEVIISAGALQTPKLLMLSGIGPKEHLNKLKIPVVADLPVGLNFHDHVRVHHFHVLDNPLTEKHHNSSVDIIDFIDQGTGYLVVPILYTLFASATSNFSRSAVPDLEIQLFIGQDYSSGIKKINEEILGPYKNDTLFFCMPFILKPKSRGIVTINSSNIFDDPIIDPNFLSHPDDIDTLVEGLKICNKIANTNSLKPLGVKRIHKALPGCECYDMQSDDYLRCQAMSMSLPCYHTVGTTKMGNIKDSSTVVDPSLKVKGIKGLRVADASVMPLIPSGDANAPAIMIGEKAADIIKSDMTCRKTGNEDELMVLSHII